MPVATAHKTTGVVLSAARQRGGAMPSVVTLHDHSRFGNDGAMTNVTWVQLPSGLWVMSFNGVSSQVNCGADDSLAIFTEITIEAWVYPTTIIGTHTICDRNYGGNLEYKLAHLGSNLYFHHGDGAAWANPAALGYFTANVWHYMAIACSVSSLFYRNGELVHTSVFLSPIAWRVGTFTIGVRGNITEYFNGYIALVRVYTYALSPGQILKHYEAERALFGV